MGSCSSTSKTIQFQTQQIQRKPFSADEEHFLTNDKQQLADWFFRDQFKFQGQVWVYSRTMKGCHLDKHYGIVIKMKSHSLPRYFSLEWFTGGLDLFHAKEAKGDQYQQLGIHLGKLLYEAYQKTQAVGNSNSLTKNCFDWVKKYVKYLGLQLKDPTQN